MAFGAVGLACGAQLRSRFAFAVGRVAGLAADVIGGEGAGSVVVRVVAGGAADAVVSGVVAAAVDQAIGLGSGR